MCIIGSIVFVGLLVVVTALYYWGTTIVKKEYEKGSTFDHPDLHKGPPY